MRIAMVGSSREMCGVAAYTHDLVTNLERFVDVAPIVAPEVTNASDCARALGQIHGGADIAHVQQHVDFYGSWRTPARSRRFVTFLRQIRVPIVLTVHDFVARLEARPTDTLKNRVFNLVALPAVNSTPVGAFLRGGFLREAHHLIVHSDASKQAVARFGVAADRISVLGPGVPSLAGDSSAASARHAWGIGEAKLITIFGFVRPSKGIETALHALAAIPEAVLLIAGGVPRPADEPYLGSLLALARSLGVEERVRVTGYLSADDLAAALKASDVIVLPYTEGLTSASYALSYAAAAERPILTSDIAYFREIRQRYDALETFRVNDAESMAAALRRILAGDVAAHGAKRYRQDESWEQVAACTADIYRRILAERPARIARQRS